jgi:hypothetical protein
MSEMQGCPARWLVRLLLAVALSLGLGAAITRIPILDAQSPPRPAIRTFTPLRPFINPDPEPIVTGGAFAAMLPLRADGGLVFVSGPVVCPTGEQAEIHSVITQDHTAAVAFGAWTGACTGAADQTWRSQASALDQPFQAGPARTCAVAIFRRDGFTTVAGQWCDDVTLTAAQP